MSTTIRRERDPKVAGLRSYRKADGSTSWSFQGRIAGRNTRRTFKHARTRSEAVAALELLRAEIRQGTVPSADPRLTIRKLVDEYLEHARSRLASTTHSTYTHHLRAYVIPHLGQRRAGELAAVDVRQFMGRIADGRIPRVDGKRGLAPASQRAILAALSSALQYGTEFCGLRSNVARDLGRRHTPSSKRLREPNYLDADELETLIAQIGDDYRALIATIAYSALRISEALSLTWRDVELEVGKVTVRNGKTDASETTAQLLPRALRALNEHRNAMAELGLQRVGPDQLVFQSRRSGKPLSRRNVLRAVHRASGKQTNLHDLRHSLAALSLDSGATIVETARLLRHSSPAVTMTVYAGLLRAKETAAAEKLAAAGVGA